MSREAKKSKSKRYKLFSILAVSKNKQNEAYLGEYRLYPATIKKIWKVCMIFDSKQNVADIFYTKQIFSFKNENKFSIFFLASFRVEPLAESVFYNI